MSAIVQTMLIYQRKGLVWKIYCSERRLGGVNQLIIGTKLQDALVKMKKHTLNTLIAHLLSIVLYIHHDPSYSVFIPIAFCFCSFCSLYFSFLLSDISLPNGVTY